MRKIISLAILVSSLTLGCGIRDIEDVAVPLVGKDGTKIIRTYEVLKHDHIFVQHPKNPEVYVALEKYLDISNLNEYDEDIKRAEIKKLAKW